MKLKNATDSVGWLNTVGPLTTSPKPPASAPREPQPSSEPEGCIRCEGEQFDGFICEGCGRRLVCWQDGSFSWLPPETDDEGDEPEPSSEASASQTDEKKILLRAGHVVIDYRGYPLRTYTDMAMAERFVGDAAERGYQHSILSLNLYELAPSPREPREPHAALLALITRWREAALEAMREGRPSDVVKAMAMEACADELEAALGEA